MKTKLAVLAAISATLWLLAQAVAPAPKPAMDLMPAGAVLYIEARNFGKLLADYNASPEKKSWIQSSNYQALLRSHLITRLVESKKAYLEAASLPETAPLLDSIAGNESAIAIYNIGKLEFLYTTRLNAGQFAGSSLAAARGKFETRKAGDFNYFIRTKGDSVIAYALANDRLYLATREDLIAKALKGETPLSKDPWFATALAKSPGPTGDLRMIANLASITKTPQFRSYWIQRNITDLKQYSSSISNVTLTTAGIKEDRVLLRANAKETQQPLEATISDLLKYSPPDAGFSQAIAKPSQETVKTLIEERLFGTATIADPASSKSAPSAADGAYIDSEDDFDTRTDQPTQSTTVQSTDPFAAIAANTDAILQTGSARLEADQVLVGLHASLVLHGIAPWNQADIRKLLGEVPNSIEGNYLILGPPLKPLNQAAPPASYSAVFRYAQELPFFERLTRLIDFPSIPPGTDAREPLFFSENLASLFRSANRLSEISITEHDLGTEVQQSVFYKLK